MELFSPFSQYVMAVFLLLFGINFALYYLLLIGKVREVLRSEELRTYLLVVAVGVTLIFTSLALRFQAFPPSYTVEEAFRHALFQVASIVTTTGFSTTDFGTWPMLATMTLLGLMFMGAMAGSTSGGMKMSRIAIAVKGAYIQVRKLINPRYVHKTKFEEKTLENDTVGGVFSFITLYFFIMVAGLLLLSVDPVNGTAVTVVSDAGTYTVTHGFFTNFSATVACLSNIGPGFEAIGPYAGYMGYSVFSKIVLSLMMLIGRLEILPVLILFNPKAWKKI
jgi:trk system potassium uptake protein TrkH